MAVTPGQQPDTIVLTLQWREPATGLASQETFGPWASGDDLAHMAAIRDFIADWTRLTGNTADVATVSIVMDPAGWAREREAKAVYDALLVERGVASAAELRRAR